MCECLNVWMFENVFNLWRFEGLNVWRFEYLNVWRFQYLKVCFCLFVCFYIFVFIIFFFLYVLFVCVLLFLYSARAGLWPESLILWGLSSILEKLFYSVETPIFWRSSSILRKLFYSEETLPGGWKYDVRASMTRAPPPPPPHPRGSDIRRLS